MNIHPANKLMEISRLIDQMSDVARAAEQIKDYCGIEAVSEDVFLNIASKAEDIVCLVRKSYAPEDRE